MRRGNTSLYSGAANGAVVQMRAEDQARLVPELPAHVAIDPLTLTTIQQAALLTMHESHVKRTLIREMLEEHHLDKPSHDDYRALADIGLSERNPGKRYHDLTTEGRTAAKALERALCIQFGVHVMTGFDPTTSSGDTSRGCSCGGWRWSGRAGQYTQANARRAHDLHAVSAMQAQELFAAMKPPVRVEG